MDHRLGWGTLPGSGVGGEREDALVVGDAGLLQLLLRLSHSGHLWARVDHP